MASFRLLGLCVVSGMAFGCGGGAPAAEVEAPRESSGREREGAGGGDPLSVTGLRGVLSQDEIQGALEPKMLKFSRCVQRRSGDVEWLSGAVTFEFRVATTGAVSSVYPRRSSMGDRATEQCMLEVAKATRFPMPRGGEAEFGWSLEVPLDSDTRAPVAWTASQAETVVAEQRSALRSACGDGSFELTAYVDVDGKVVAVGGAVADEASAEKLDCVTSVVQSWVFPSPGSYAAKLTFNLD